MILCDEKPSLVKLRGYVENGVDELLCGAVRSYLEHLPPEQRDYLDELDDKIDRLEKPTKG